LNLIPVSLQQDKNRRLLLKPVALTWMLSL